MLRRRGLFAGSYLRCFLFSRRSCATVKGESDTSAASPNRSKYDALLSGLKEKEQLIEKMTTDVLYSAAACENLRKEMLGAKKNAEEQAIASFAMDMLEVCDALQVVTRLVDEYLQNNELVPPAQASVLSGIKLTEEVAVKTLKRHGVSKICTTIGHPFDETMQEKLYTVPSSAEIKDGNIAEIIKDGYLLNGSVLRKAQVALGEDP
ncbi:Co-chaperone GrpE [Lotmaria passim]